MKVSFYCGHYKQSWLGIGSEPSECCNSGEIEVDEDEWNEKAVGFDCEKCGNYLDQNYDHFEKVE